MGNDFSSAADEWRTRPGNSRTIAGRNAYRPVAAEPHTAAFGATADDERQSGHVTHRGTDASRAAQSIPHGAAIGPSVANSTIYSVKQENPDAIRNSERSRFRFE